MTAVAHAIYDTDTGELLPVRRLARPSWLILITCITAVYLVIEFAFNARLLDISGLGGTHDQVKSIEHWGRFISGFAVALVYIGAMGLPKKHHIAVMTLITAAIIGVVVVGEKAWIDHLVSQSTGEQRKAAYYADFLREASLSGEVSLVGLSPSSAGVSTPEQKAFMALLPALSFSRGDLSSRIDSNLPAMIQRQAVRDFGGADGYYNRAFLPSAKGMIESFALYGKVVNALSEQYAGIPALQDSQWREYRHALAGHGLRPGRIPARYFKQVRQQVIKMGMQVPATWNPNDRNGFDDAITRSVKTVAMKKYDEAITGIFGAGVRVPYSLTTQRMFFAAPEIQALWRNKLHIKERVAIDPGMTEQEVKKSLWPAFLANNLDTQMAKFTGPSSAFEDGHASGNEGRAAMEMVLVPPSALMFSVLGALLHLFKLSRFLMMLAWIGKDRRSAVIAIASTLLIAWMAWMSPNDITRSSLYARLDSGFSGTQGALLATGMTWVIQAEHFAYPVNEWLRQNAMLGFEFGYKGQS